MRYVLACLTCFALVLAGCQTPPAAPAAPAATEAPAADATPTEEMTSTEEMTHTEEMSPTEEMTSTEAMTETEEMTSKEETTAAEVSVPFEVIQIIQEYDPDAWSPPHSHGGPGMATVIEGELTRRLGAAGEEEAVFGPGEFFYEYAGEIFNTGNAGQEQVQMAVVFLLPQGAILTTPVTGTAMADMPPGPTVLSRTSMTITESLGNFDVVEIILDFAPGTSTPLHSHGGHGLVTVLEGEITHTPEATGEEMVYGPGEFFTETPGALHVAGNAGQENARLAAIFLLPEGASLTTVADGTSSDDLPPGPTVVSSTSFSVTTAAEGATSTGMTDDEKIANVMIGGIPSIVADAAVLDWPSEEGAEAVELRAGTNGWLCRTDDPITPVNDPRCFDANWQLTFGKEFGPEREAHSAFGFAYMLNGGNAADNDNPDLIVPVAGQEWQTDPPHVMVDSPIQWDPAIYSNDHHNGGPWVMFGGSPWEHVMFPIEMVPLESEAGDDKIANALSAGPSSIREGAAVMDWPTEAGGELTELQAGTNGWTCLPDNPTNPANDPACVDAAWLEWFSEYLAGEEPEVTSVGFAYMLQGGSVADNNDPSLTEPAAGAEWQVDPPHVMIVSPEPLDLSLYSTEMHTGGPWVMWGGTPFEHIMFPLTDPIDEH